MKKQGKQAKQAWKLSALVAITVVLAACNSGTGGGGGNNGASGNTPTPSPTPTPNPTPTPTPTPTALLPLPVAPTGEAALPALPASAAGANFRHEFPTNPLVVANSDTALLPYTISFAGYNSSLWTQVTITPSLPYEYVKDGTQRWLKINTVGAKPQTYAVDFKLYNEGGNLYTYSRALLRVTPDPTKPSVVNPALQIVNAGQEFTVSLDITPPANGTPITAVTLQNPAEQLLSTELSADHKSVTVKVNPQALSQGPVPLSVLVKAGDKVQEVRIPIIIGNRIQNEFNRFNAVRAQAGLNPVTFEPDMAMNCWMHGIYRAAGNNTGHTEYSNLPGYSDAGKTCAEHSNLSAPSFSTPTDDAPYVASGLFSAPFHAIGMLKPNQTTVAIGDYVAPVGNRYQIYGGISSNGNRGTQPVYFPGQGQTTDFSSYTGNENPDPVESCPGYNPKLTGLPLIYMSNTAADTTVTDATLTTNGQSLPICAFGSTQYVNNSGKTLIYTSGPKLHQDVGRDILKASGGVIVVPKDPLKSASTYTLSMKVNGNPVSWSFNTANTLRSTSLNMLAPDEMPASNGPE